MKTLPEFTNVVFREDPQLADRCKLDVYLPENQESFPTLIWFYGGGMVEGEKHLPPGLEDQGVAVVTPNYRLSPQTTHPGYIEDAAAAVAWTFENCASFGGDPDRVFIGGLSAGAYLASMVQLDKNWLAPYGIDPDRSLGLIALSGQLITHFTIRQEQGIPAHHVIVDELAPLRFVRADAPPICLITGDRDLELLARYQENAYFQAILTLAGHQQNELHELPGKDHGGVEPGGLIHSLNFIRKYDRV
ncbi:alpha/beta hydrolase [Kiritimatiellota bacterium B12222]|nr:alpha/beta hydrolase [Kiritimatiellota bacterium B12222]